MIKLKEMGLFFNVFPPDDKLDHPYWHNGRTSSHAHCMVLPRLWIYCLQGPLWAPRSNALCFPWALTHPRQDTSHVYKHWYTKYWYQNLEEIFALIVKRLYRCLWLGQWKKQRFIIVLLIVWLCFYRDMYFKELVNVTKYRRGQDKWVNSTIFHSVIIYK